MQGWIKLHRKLIEWEWYHNSEMVHLFIHLILKANHQDGQWQGVSVNKGQLITGRKKLSEETRLSEQKIRGYLNKLKSTSDITIKPTNRFSLITICNYCTYQPSGRESNQPVNQQPDQQLTNKQPTVNQQLTTNKNEENENNGNNDNIYTLQQVKDAGCLIGIPDDECEVFFNHYQSQGWVKGNGLPISDLSAQMTNWKKNGHKHEPKEDDKQAKIRKAMQYAKESRDRREGGGTVAESIPSGVRVAGEGLF